MPQGSVLSPVLPTLVGAGEDAGALVDPVERLTFWLNSHLEKGGSLSLLILPGLLRSDWGGLTVSSPLGEWEDACGLRR